MSEDMREKDIRRYIRKKMPENILEDIIKKDTNKYIRKYIWRNDNNNIKKYIKTEY